jgi:hypothetical protein
MEILSVYRKRTGDKVLTAYIFQQIAKKGKAEGIDDLKRQRDARKWYRESAEKVKTVNKNRMMTDKENLVDKILLKDIGRMYMFFYDPKHKEELPYYDTFPLIFPIEFKPDGFLGINLHYLPHMLRAKLMDALYQTANNKKMDDTTKLKISYSILSTASKYKYFKPCLKHYLWDHVRSRYLNVQPHMWDVALMLPLERFKKATKQRVWKESQEMVNK